MENVLEKDGYFGTKDVYLSLTYNESRMANIHVNVEA